MICMRLSFISARDGVVGEEIVVGFFFPSCIDIELKYNIVEVSDI